MGGPRATPAAAPGIEGGAAEEELRSRGRAGRFVSTAHSRPYVTMATASAWAGREPEPLRHHGPGPRQPRNPRPSSHQLGSVEKTRAPPPDTPSHRQCRHSRVSESLARETGRLQRALSTEPDLIAVQALLCFLSLDIPEPYGPLRHHTFLLWSSALETETHLKEKKGQYKVINY